MVGASGAIGEAVARLARERGLRVLGTYMTRTAPGLTPFDMRRQSLTDLAPDLGPGDTVVLLSAIAKIDSFLEREAEAYSLNVEATRRLVLQAHERGAHALFLSTNQIFDGLAEGGYDEDSKTNPLNPYGRQKVEIEDFLAGSSGPWTVVRTGWNVTRRLEDRCVVLETHQALLVPGARMAGDNLINVTAVDDTATGIIAAIQGRVGGILHCANPRPVSRLELAELVKRVSRNGEGMRFETISDSDRRQTLRRSARAWLKLGPASLRLGVSYRPLEEVVSEKVALIERGSPADASGS